MQSKKEYETNAEFVGKWQILGEKESDYFGTLLIEGEEILLDLLECLRTPKNEFIIHGLTTDGKIITLMGCVCTGRSMSAPGVPSCRIDAKYAIFGAHLDSINFPLDAAKIKLSNFEYWLGVSGFSDYKFDEKNISLNYTTPNGIVMYQTQELKYSVTFRRTAPIFGPLCDLSIKQEALITIRHRAPFDLITFWKDVNLITSFLTLGYFAQPQVMEVIFVLGEKNILCRYRGQKLTNSEVKNHKLHFLFTYQLVQHDPLSYFHNWAKLRDKAAPVIEAIHESFSDRETIVENKFLNIIHGIESFHRRTRNNLKFPKAIHENIVSEILEACPENHKKWLQEKLNFSNEPTLADRLDELFGEINEQLKNRFFDDIEALKKDVKHSRNYYTHYDSSLEKKALKGVALLKITEKLRIFLLMILLKELQFSDDDLTKIIIEGSNFHFNHLIVKAN